MKLARLFLLSLFVLTLTSCSSTFLYNQLDWLIPWYLDDYVDLTRAQKKQRRDSLAAAAILRDFLETRTP